MNEGSYHRKHGAVPWTPAIESSLSSCRRASAQQCPPPAPRLRQHVTRLRSGTTLVASLLGSLRALLERAVGVAAAVALQKVSIAIHINNNDKIAGTYATLHLQLADLLLLGQTIVVVAVKTALVARFLGSLGAFLEGPIGVAASVGGGVLVLCTSQSRSR